MSTDLRLAPFELEGPATSAASPPLAACHWWALAALDQILDDWERLSPLMSGRRRYAKL
jgi:hypothetical protein